MRWAAWIAVATCLSCDGALRFGSDGDAGLSSIGDASGTTAIDAAQGAPDASARSLCTVDSDCPISTLHCDVATGACVACLSDAQCTSPGFPRCDAALHSCVPCGSDIDCPTDEICEATSHQCVQSCAEGPTEHDCPTTAPTCNEKQMFCVACTSDSECASITDDGNICNLNNGRCVFCLDNSQCDSSAPLCDTTRGRCVGCLTSADCSSSEYCDPDRLECL